MEKYETNFCRPIFFKKNRVNRVYTGGALFADFFGDDSIDCYEPEEWIASTVSAVNKETRRFKEGVSVIEDTDIYFDDLINRHREDMLGKRNDFGVLVKILDSAVRLPVQAHPDKAFSRKNFGSEYGKAESWLVLAARPGARIYFGFDHRVSKKDFMAATEKTLYDKNAVIPYINEVSVSVGDVYFVPAGMVHAIGAGCLMLEVQEPSDFTIQPEHMCADYRLDENEMYIGLDRDTAFDVFDYNIYGADALKAGKKEPVTVYESNGIKKEILISYSDTPCFSLQRITLTNSVYTPDAVPSVYVVTDGEGEIQWDGGSRKIKKGSYFFLPYALQGNAVIKTKSTMQFAICLPPKI